MSEESSGNQEEFEDYFEKDNSKCPGCGNTGQREFNQAIYYTCTNDSCDVWYYGRENRSGGESSTDHSGQRTEDPEGSSKQATNKLVEPPKPDAWLFKHRYVYSDREDNRIATASLDSTEEHDIAGNIEPLYSGQTIRQTIERYCRYLEHQAKEELTEEERQELDDIKNELQNLGEVFDSE